MTVDSKVSIVIPVYNASDTLKLTIDSLLQQTLKDIEIIIVNDASTDNTAEVIESLVQKNKNIIAVDLSKNKGAHEARLAGLTKASAPWIGFMDADDFARPKMYENLLFSAEVNKVDVVVCGFDRVNSSRKKTRDGLHIDNSKRVSDKIFERFCKFEFGTGMLWNKLYRREIISPFFNLHYPWRQNTNEDLLLNIGCFYNAKSIYLLDNILYEYVDNKKSITSNISRVNACIETFRAFAVALTVYQNFPKSAKENIIDLYRRQLSFNSYQTKSIKLDFQQNESLTKAVRLLAEVNPTALGLISFRWDLDFVGVRLASKSLLHAIKKRIKFLKIFIK